MDLWRKSCIPRFLYRRDHRMEYWSTVVAKSSGGRRNGWSRVSSTHLPSAMNFDHLTVGVQVLNIRWLWHDAHPKLSCCLAQVLNDGCDI